MQEYTRICRSIQEYAEIFRIVLGLRNMQEYARVHKDMQECTRVCRHTYNIIHVYNYARSMQEYTGICWSIQEYAGENKMQIHTCTGIQEYTRVCKNMDEYARVNSNIQYNIDESIIIRSG